MSFEYHPAVLAADTTDYQAGTLSRMGKAISYGGTAAAVSGAMSIYNSLVFKDAEVDIQDAVTRFGGEEMGDYYAENKSAIDIVGFVGGAIGTGGLGMAGLKLARAGVPAGNFSKFLNYAPSRKAEYLKKGLEETALSGGIRKGIFTRNRLKYAQWEAADQAMIGAAAELAIFGLMRDSPVFDDSTASDFGWNAALGIGLSGGIGAVLGSVAARGILKSAETQIQHTARQYDVLADAQLMGLSPGTESLILAESLEALPTLTPDITFKYKLDGKAIEEALPTAEAFKRIRMESQQLGKDALAMRFNVLADNDERIGQAYFKFLQARAEADRAAGLTPTEITQKLHGYLANMRKVSAINFEQHALDSRKFYVAQKLEAGTPLERVTSLFSKVRTQLTGKQAYRMAEGLDQSDAVVVRFADVPETRLNDAFRNHRDVDMFQLNDGTLRINRLSTRLVRHREQPYEIKQLIDLETGVMVGDTPATVGDILQKGKLSIQRDAIYVNNVRYAQPASKVMSMAESPLQTTARWLWAANLDERAFKSITEQTVDLADFPMAQRLAELAESGAIKEDQLRLFKLTDDGVDVSWDDIADLRTALEDKRLTWLEGEYANWREAMGSVPDTRVLAAHLNTSYDWVEDAIGRGYVPRAADEAPVGRVFDTAAAANPRAVQATWSFDWVPGMIPEEAYKMNMGPSHLITQELTKEYQRIIRRSIGENAAVVVYGADAGQFQAADNLLSMDSTASGAGASLFGAANASYGERAKLWVQNTGRAVAQATIRRVDETVQTLAPYINAMRESPIASAEWGIVTNMLRGSEHRYVFHPTPSIGQHVLVTEDVLKLAKVKEISVDDALALMPVNARSPAFIKIDDDNVAGFFRTSAAINHTRQDKATGLFTAMGLTRNLPDQPVVYAPPVNTVRYPFYAFVKAKEKLGLGTGTTVITARTEEQLRAQIAKLGDDFDVYFDKNVKDYYKVKGEYDYSLTLNEAAVNSAVARKGALSDVMPETRFENINEDWLQWHAKEEEKLLRNAVQVQSREFFSEMRILSDQYRKVSEGRTGGIGSRAKAKVEDPFGDYIKTALNISKQQEFPLLDSLNEFVDKVGYKIGEAFNSAFRDARSGVISWEDANWVMANKGMGVMYKDWEQYIAQNERFPKNAIKLTFQKVNMALATTMLRFDMANSLVNTISTPILLGTELTSIRQGLAKNDPLMGKLNELMSLPVPGRPGQRVPGTTHLIGNATNNFFGANKAALIARYKAMGAMKGVADQYHQMLGLAAVDPRMPMSQFSKQADQVVEMAAKLSGNTLSEDFTRFVSADVMRQITDPIVSAGKMTVKEQDAYIGTFVNRVQGNYVTSQRPIVFQGTTGAAVSLFQTYAFNVLQQLFRHVERGDKKTLAVFAGLQGSIFGLNGLPFFDAVNTHLIGSLSGNTEHKDAYSTLPAFNKELGDWMLYGTASAFPLFTGDSPAFFTRGDINPRHALILPTAIMDVPAVSASFKLLDTLDSFAKNVYGGADVGDSLLKALQHQGWNRPLAGFAQLMAGQSVDRKGALISAANELQTTGMLAGLVDRTVSLEGATRLMGARPMDEAVALNAVYRNKSYEAMDRARIERLGAIVKTKLYNNTVPEQEELEDFMLRYTRSGGRIENFNQAMQRWSRDANVSIVNQLADRMGGHYPRTLNTIMGGDRIEDYRNPPTGFEQLEE